MMKREQLRKHLEERYEVARGMKEEERFRFGTEKQVTVGYLSPDKGQPKPRNTGAYQGIARVSVSVKRRCQSSGEQTSFRRRRGSSVRKIHNMEKEKQWVGHQEQEV